ncbi:hypothetical protein ACFHW2_41585, partial [Actinomadura sp. LOL_016]|uniref:hypothetical protein n=1 Tax=Actinomadura sp. LOL_016 TaxID=3345411 RepID=UPI003A8A9DFF
SADPTTAAPDAARQPGLDGPDSAGQVRRRSRYRPREVSPIVSGTTSAAENRPGRPVRVFDQLGSHMRRRPAGARFGGGAPVRVPRLTGVARMVDMILVGRRHDTEQQPITNLSRTWSRTTRG